MVAEGAEVAAEGDKRRRLAAGCEVAPAAAACAGPGCGAGDGAGALGLVKQGAGARARWWCKGCRALLHFCGEGCAKRHRAACRPRPAGPPASAVVDLTG